MGKLAADLIVGDELGIIRHRGRGPVVRLALEAAGLVAARDGAVDHVAIIELVANNQTGRHSVPVLTDIEGRPGLARAGSRDRAAQIAAFDRQILVVAGIANAGDDGQGLERLVLDLGITCDALGGDVLDVVEVSPDAGGRGRRGDAAIGAFLAGNVLAEIVEADGPVDLAVEEFVGEAELLTELFGVLDDEVGRLDFSGYPGRPLASVRSSQSLFMKPVMEVNWPIGDFQPMLADVP